MDTKISKEHEAEIMHGCAQEAAGRKEGMSER